MCPKCVHTQMFALLKSIINILLYQTLQNTNRRRNRKSDIFPFFASQVIRNFVSVRQISVVAGTVPVVGYLNMLSVPSRQVMTGRSRFEHERIYRTHRNSRRI